MLTHIASQMPPAVEPNFDDLGVSSESGRYFSLERLIEQNKVPYGHPEATPRPP
jgi:hypothetical protein